MASLLIIELGTGYDLHGQDVTVAARRAVRNAIERISLPGIQELTGGDLGRMQVHVRLAVPADTERVDRDAVLSELPYGQKTLEIVAGGMLTRHGIFLADRGDRNGDIYVVNAAIEVSVQATDAG